MVYCICVVIGFALGLMYNNSGICLHCGEGKPMYCEDCFQELATENLKLQQEEYIHKLHNIQVFENKIENPKIEIIEENQNHIPHVD